MTPERFQQIVQAYGAQPDRWPQAERADAEAWAAAHRNVADALTDEAAALDDWLAASRIEPAGAALQQRIVDSAPGRARRRPAAPRRRWWWSGAAVAGVGLLGGAAGAFAVSFFVLTASAPPVHEFSYLTSSFGGSSADWSGE